MATLEGSGFLGQPQNDQRTFFVGGFSTILLYFLARFVLEDLIPNFEGCAYFSCFMN